MTDKQLISVARAMRRGILGKRPSAKQCMVVSASLQGYLSAVHGVQTELITVDFPEIDHVFLKLADGRILDPTADQFGLDAIYLGEMPELYRGWIGETQKWAHE